MGDEISPLHSWSLPEVLQNNAGRAENDIHAKLYCHVQSLFRKFHRRMARLDVEFQILCVDALNLREFVKGQKFARIDVSTARQPT